MKKTTLIKNIENKIHIIRGVQVILDSDLAKFYQVETRRLNEQVRRNKERFPEEFMFQLTKHEYEILKSQFATSTYEHGGRRKLPYAFTEQGVSMLSAVLNSKTAIKISIQIINAFVEMRKFISENKDILHRLKNIENKQLQYDTNFNKIFTLLENSDIKPQKGIFFEGQLFDAHKFISDLIRDAKKSIKLIDNYIDDRTLSLLGKRKKGVKVTIYTKKITKNLKQDLEKFNSQYEPITIKEFSQSHDRFLIIDSQVYHIGASLKDLGNKWFGFSKIEKESLEITKRLK